VRIDRVVDLLVVLQERSGQAGDRFGMHASAAGERDRVGWIDRVGGRAPEPAVAVREKAVSPGNGHGQRALRVVGLDAAVYRVFLIPEQAALDVHILKGDGRFGPDQGRQIADLHRERIVRCQLQNHTGKAPKKFAVALPERMYGAPRSGIE